MTTVLLRSALKLIAAINIVLLFLFSSSLYARSGMVAAPVPQSKILTQQQNVEAGQADEGFRLLLASVDVDDKHKKNCEARDRKGKCRPFKKLEVRRLYKLKFGKVVASAGSQGAVTIDPENGNKTVAGAYDGGGRHGPAEYEIEGEPEQEIVVTFPEDMLLKGNNGGASDVLGFTGFFTGNRTLKKDARVVGKLGRDGKAVLLVGGTVKIPSNHGTGRMRGRSEIIVEYLH